MVSKSLLKISFVGAGNIINAGLGFLFIAAVAKVLPLDTFGKYALITSILVPVAKITDFGTNSLFVAHSITKSEHLISKFLSLKLLLLITTFPISFIILSFFKLTDAATLSIFYIGLLAYTVNFAFFGFFQKLEKFEFVVLLNTIPAIIKGFFAVLVFLNIVSLNLTQAFLIFSGSIIPSLLLYFYLPKNFFHFDFSLKGIKELFKETFPAGTSQLISEGWSAVANSIAKIAQGYTDVGLYSIADKVSSIFSLVSLSIFTVLLPKNARHKKDTNKYDFKETLLLSVLIMILSIFAILFAKIFLPVIFGTKFSGSIALLNIMIIASALAAIHSFMENYFYIENRTGTLFFISTSKLSVFLIFSFLLVPTLNLIGLAYAQLAASSVALLITVISMNLFGKIKQNTHRSEDLQVLSDQTLS